jgi:hypothetical protein
MAIVLLKKDADAAQLFALCYIIPEFCTQMAPAAHCREHFEI